MEKTMWGGAVTRQQLQQNITRLRTLNKVPEKPKENVLSSQVDSTHRLSLSREKEIASNLAFLSATSDDSRKVMAVCLEEYRNGEGVIIRIASNSGDLVDVTSGFVMLAKVLEQAARRENTKSEDIELLLRRVIVLDYRRILSRLRSRHAEKSWKTDGKPPLISQLNKVVHGKFVKPISGFTESNWKVVSNRTTALKVLYSRLESELGLPGEAIILQILGEIVKEAHELTVVADLSTALQSYSGDPSLTSHLREAIGKLGRYYSATSELICAARNRKCRIFQNIRVEPFKIPISASVQEAPSKVHAEIKLLFFYELHPDRPRPRIICSSKSACFLCNLFFSLHGGFQVPRTHGRLYDKWILPDWLEVPIERRRVLGGISTRLNATLENKVQTTMKSKKRRFPPPNESVLLLPAHWSSSAPSRSLISSPLTSTSTIRPQPPLIQEENPSYEMSLSTQLPLTPPIMPLELRHAANSDTETVAGLGAVDSADESVQKIIASDTALDAASDAVSLITVKRSQLPYSQSITVKMPPLHLQLDDLSLSLDFIPALSGSLLITQVIDTGITPKGNRVVNIEDIPTSAELQVNCSYGSNELTIQLQNNQKGIICMTFVWDKFSDTRDAL